jgi:hypothetical protein
VPKVHGCPRATTFNRVTGSLIHACWQSPGHELPHACWACGHTWGGLPPVPAAKMVQPELLFEVTEWEEPAGASEAADAS